MLTEEITGSTKRHSTMATKFFQLGVNNFITSVRFSLRSRDVLESFMKTLDSDTRKPIDLFFIIEELNLSKEDNNPEYRAVFTWFIGAKEHTVKAFENIVFCEVLEIEVITVGELFKKMCEINFIEYGMFERLGRADIKTLKSTSNPFAQVYLFKNVSYFTNLDSASHFISQEMLNLPNHYELLNKKKEMR